VLDDLMRGTAQSKAGETAEPSSAYGDEARIPSGRVRQEGRCGLTLELNAIGHDTGLPGLLAEPRQERSRRLMIPRERIYFLSFRCIPDVGESDRAAKQCNETQGLDSGSLALGRAVETAEGSL
jgi:hypothetical protein